MRKRFAVLLTVVLILSVGFALSDAIDYAAMTDYELHSMVDAARNELAKRELVTAKDIVLFEQDGVSIYLTGKYNMRTGIDNTYLDLESVLVNNSDVAMNAAISIASVNGWGVAGSGIYEVASGKKKKDMLELKVSDADISAYEEIEDIELIFRLYDSVDYKTVSKTGPITIQFPIQ